MLEVNWDNMPEIAKQHIIEYGLKQKLNDAGSSATVKELGSEAGAQALAMAENVLEALMQGKVTVRSAGVSMTLEQKEFNKLIKALYKKLVGKPSADFDIEEGLEELAKKLKKPVEVLKPALEAKAKANAEIARQVAVLRSDSIDIEL
jgi:hypothetical protein